MPDQHPLLRKKNILFLFENLRRNEVTLRQGFRADRDFDRRLRNAGCHLRLHHRTEIKVARVPQAEDLVITIVELKVKRSRRPGLSARPILRSGQSLWPLRVLFVGLQARHRAFESECGRY